MQLVLPHGVTKADAFQLRVEATVNGQQVLDTAITTHLIDTRVDLHSSCGGYDLVERKVKLTAGGQLVDLDGSAGP